MIDVIFYLHFVVCCSGLTQSVHFFKRENIFPGNKAFDHDGVAVRGIFECALNALELDESDFFYNTKIKKCRSFIPGEGNGANGDDEEWATVPDLMVTQSREENEKTEGNLTILW